MKIEINSVNNGTAEAGSMILRTYTHMKFYYVYHTAPQMYINGQQARIRLGTATPDARLHVTAGVSTAFGDDGTSTWLGNIGMMNSSGGSILLGYYIWFIMCYFLY